MSDTEPSAQGEPDSPDTDGRDWKRRSRLAAVFGDVLPDTTSDERDVDAGSTSPSEADDAGDRWLRSQVPPHHG
jgi:hypothetical protein